MFVSLEVFSVWLIRVTVVAFGIAIIYSLINHKSAYRISCNNGDGTSRYRPMTWPEYIRHLWEIGQYNIFVSILIWFVLAIPYLRSLIVH